MHLCVISTETVILEKLNVFVSPVKFFQKRDTIVVTCKLSRRYVAIYREAQRIMSTAF